MKRGLLTADSGCAPGIKRGLGIKPGLRTGYETRARYKTRTEGCGPKCQSTFYTQSTLWSAAFSPRFIPAPQSTFYTYLVLVLYPVRGPQSAFYTDRYFNVSLTWTALARIGRIIALFWNLAFIFWLRRLLDKIYRIFLSLTPWKHLISRYISFLDPAPLQCFNSF